MQHLLMAQAARRLDHLTSMMLSSQLVKAYATNSQPQNKTGCARSECRNRFGPTRGSLNHRIECPPALRYRPPSNVALPPPIFGCPGRSKESAPGSDLLGRSCTIRDASTGSPSDALPPCDWAIPLVVNKVLTVALELYTRTVSMSYFSTSRVLWPSMELRP